MLTLVFVRLPSGGSPKWSARVRPQLLNSLDNHDKNVRSWAAKILTDLTGHQLGDDPAGWRDWWVTHADQ